jgi:hypothetical protein
MHSPSRLPRARTLRNVIGVGLLAAGVVAAPAARADDTTSEQAQQLEQQLHDWLAALLGPHVAIGEHPVHFAPEEDHFRLDIPVAGPLGGTGVTVEAEPISAVVKPLDGGRWAIDEIHSPSPLKVTFAMAGADATTVTATIDEQDQHAVLDPSLASASSWDATLKGYDSVAQGANNTRRATHIGQIVAHLAGNPVTDGRIDLLEDVDTTLLTSDSDMPNVGKVLFSAERMHVVAHIDSVAPDRVTTILHTVFELVPEAMAKAAARRAAGEAKDAPADATADKAADGKMTPEQHASLRAGLVALTELTSGVGEQITMENLHLTMPGHEGHAAKAMVGLGGDAPDGKLAMRMSFSLDGLDSPEIPAGIFRDYLPRHIAFAPRIGGIPAADVKDLLLRAVDSEGNDPALKADSEALLQKGPLLIGLDDVSLDAGPATLAANGEVQITGRDQYAGQAHIAVTGFDALMRQVGAVPELKQAGPILIFLKGIGQQNGDTIVWDINYADKKLLVNGNDMSQLIPGGGGGSQ